jgi:DNA polymerase III epsilon subunit-like protein
MLILVFDTETTGLPQSKILSVDTLDKWPHIVQFSYIIYDTDKNEIVRIHDDIIKIPQNIIISDEVSKIHGITNEITEKKGIHIDIAIDKFIAEFTMADMIVAHNINFDLNIIKVEILRIIHDTNLDITSKTMYTNFTEKMSKHSQMYCTMQDNIDLCNITSVTKFGKKYVKFPRLEELHEKLFQTKPKNLHNSLNDVLITLRCFMYTKFNVDIVDIDCNENKINENNSKNVNNLFQQLI